jgi:hypothetical protein
MVLYIHNITILDERKIIIHTAKIEKNTSENNAQIFYDRANKPVPADIKLSTISLMVGVGLFGTSVETFMII